MKLHGPGRDTYSCHQGDDQLTFRCFFSENKIYGEILKKPNKLT